MSDPVSQSNVSSSGNAPVSLADRLQKRTGPILISGVQALVRLMLLQSERDEAAGLKTGGFVSGYRGSPLGTLDTAFAQAGQQVTDRGIVVRPAVNEEMGATAVAGTQQIAQTPSARVDGIFSLWYGKGPGLDRASDALRHGVFQGSSPHGGVVLAVGDDHLSKSSSIVCSSDEVVAALQTPLFYPADPREIIEYGLHGFAMSRHTGSYAALKIITEVADSTRVIDTDELAVAPILPEIEVPSVGLHNNWPETPLEQETRLVDFKLPAVSDYVRANKLDKIEHKAEGAKIGIIAAGKSWHDLGEALRLLGLDEARMTALGLALYKPALVWPLEPQGLAEFSDGLEAIIVVEEKNDFIERQVKAILYGRESTPKVCGKLDLEGGSLVPATGNVTPEMIGALVGGVIANLSGDAQLADRVSQCASSVAILDKFSAPPALRKPFFCSGCPHNRSTVVPEGSRALAGIGCHGLAAYHRPRTGSFAQMGGEGAHWVGLSPFTDEDHVFANMGDGTYFHSGILAIRQAVSAGVNITYKLLYNSAVAMTGGQQVDGELSVSQLVDQLRAENVDTIIISTDAPESYGATHPLRNKVERIEHRDELESLQRELRDRSGVSVIVYEQVCATELRRMRKRGKVEDPSTRVFINELVCEGCGDCSVKSNCLSVEPVETDLGTKRKINQSSCNKDLSCVTGFCPSFVTVEGGKPRKESSQVDIGVAGGALPEPKAQPLHDQRVVIGGVGGTGVVTIGALMAMAGHMNGRQVGVLDQIGMSQKGGAVVSHVNIGKGEISALRVPAENASLVLICDEIVGNSADVLSAISQQDTAVLVNSDVSVTGDFTQDRNARPDTQLLTRRLKARAGQDNLCIYPFTQLSSRLLGDAVGSNLMMMGFAWQKGWLEMDFDSLEAAIKLNNTAVAMNLDAFAIGRRLAADPDAVLKAANFAAEEPSSDSLDVSEVVSSRVEFLAAYQNAEYAKRYSDVLHDVEAAESAIGDGRELTKAVAKGLFRLMAYKDEYEVARLYTDGAFARDIENAFEGDVKLTFHMAPPIFSKKDKATGHLRKRAFGGWMMPFLRLLAKARGLRGTPFDVFGYTAERRSEREMIGEYEGLVRQLLDGLTHAKLAEAVQIAEMVQEVRGYGHVKEAAMAEYRAALKTRLNSPEIETPHRISA